VSDNGEAKHKRESNDAGRGYVCSRRVIRVLLVRGAPGINASIMHLYSISSGLVWLCNTQAVSRFILHLSTSSTVEVQWLVSLLPSPKRTVSVRAKLRPPPFSLVECQLHIHTNRTSSSWLTLPRVGPRMSPSHDPSHYRIFPPSMVATDAGSWCMYSQYSVKSTFCSRSR
jgi:hypothetical protein